ncbi:macro domain-containing protein [Micromonospora zamorensis]|uniref:macro domain-containing protein n=1 Tax=Micromonospora zamorensis TaxID=709883 RepID=UPI00340DDD78
MRWLLTRRGMRRLTAYAFTGFASVALLLQTYQAIWNRSIYPRREMLVALVVAAAALAYGVARAWPPSPVRRRLKHPDCSVEIIAGDLFDQTEAHLVIGFTDVFDTDTTDDRIIRHDSVQGQFLSRVYDDDLARLDAELEVALASVHPVGMVSRQAKPLGKRARYPLGTVAVLGVPRRLFLCVAYSVMSPDLVAQSGPDELWRGLSRLWSAVHRRGQRGRLAMPVVGTGLARIDTLQRQTLIKMILLSFVAASRQRVVTRELTIVVPPKEFAELDRLELQDFLNSL